MSMMEIILCEVWSFLLPTQYISGTKGTWNFLIQGILKWVNKIQRDGWSKGYIFKLRCSKIDAIKSCNHFKKLNQNSCEMCNLLYSNENYLHWAQWYMSLIP